MVLDIALTISGGESASLTWLSVMPTLESAAVTSIQDSGLVPGGVISPPESGGLSWRNGSSKENQGAVTKVGERYGGQNPRAQAELTHLRLHHCDRASI